MDRYTGWKAGGWLPVYLSDNATWSVVGGVVAGAAAASMSAGSDSTIDAARRLGLQIRRRIVDAKARRLELVAAPTSRTCRTATPLGFGCKRSLLFRMTKLWR